MTADGSPGIRNRIEVVEPPYIEVTGQATVYVTPDFDISDALIARMNAAEGASER